MYHIVLTFLFATIYYSRRVFTVQRVFFHDSAFIFACSFPEYTIQFFVLTISKEYYTLFMAKKVENRRNIVNEIV